MVETIFQMAEESSNGTLAAALRRDLARCLLKKAKIYFLDTGLVKGDAVTASQENTERAASRSSRHEPPQLAERTGFSDEDAETIKAVLPRLFVNDESAARPAGSMRV